MESSDFLREKWVFGPIHSRRLGNSLGINLLPEEGKICNFDCIYCECGWNKDGRGDTLLPTAGDIRAALRTKLSQLAAGGVQIDSITFSGDGEPTLNPDFPRIIDDTLALRDEFFPHCKVSVLSNATRVHVPAVFEALRKVDNPIMKIDAPTDELVAVINRPAPGYSLARVIEALKAFEGDFVLQTMFLRAEGCASEESPASSAVRHFDSSEPARLAAWKDIVRLLHPREVMVYTIARPTPAAGLGKFTYEQMHALVSDLIDEGYNIQIRS